MSDIKDKAKELQEDLMESADDLGVKAKKATASAKEKIGEFAHDANEARVHFTETLSNATEKTVGFFEPITHQVREAILSFGEVVVTIFVVVGLVAAVIGGLSDMANVGFFAGLSSMFQEIVTVVMGALVIFLLFAIKDSLDRNIEQ
jgi:predicted lipid-binding transport protein (Tim44 family)